MKLNQVRDVIAVAERGSLRAAARYLGMTQPAITRSIRELERELGVTLFERHSKGVILTPMGEIFLRRARSVQRELMRAQDELAQYTGGVSGHLRICLSTASHIALLPSALRTFRERYPGVELDIVEGLFGAAERGIKDGSFDCYIGPLAEEALAGDLLVEKLFDNQRVVFCRKGHPLAGATSLRELAQAEWVGTTVTIKADAELGPIFRRYGLQPPSIAVHSSSALTMITVTAFSDLLSMLPLQWTTHPWTEHLLECIEVREYLPAASMYIVRRTGLPLTPAAEYFCDLARRAAQHHTL